MVIAPHMLFTPFKKRVDPGEPLLDQGHFFTREKLNSKNCLGHPIPSYCSILPVKMTAAVTDNVQKSQNKINMPRKM